MSNEGPTFIRGALFLAICIAAAVRLHSHGAAGGVAVAVAVAHFVSGFAYTMIGTSFTRPIKEIGEWVYLLSVPAALCLLVYSFFVV
jgi:hypothetical protein